MLKEKYSIDEFFAYKEKAISEMDQIRKKLENLIKTESRMDYENPIITMAGLNDILEKAENLKIQVDEVAKRIGTIYRLCFQLKQKPMDKGFVNSTKEYNLAMKKNKRLKRSISTLIDVIKKILKKFERGEVYGDS